ncbi:serine protease [Methanosarcina hadiensis]|uniref:serine protease n=1 Tax=Methanosarcina hadiensis TaxID=3078083 RepID=UPI003977DA5E
MIKSGGSFLYNGARCTIGAVVFLKGLPYMVTVSHIFRGEGDFLTADGMKLTVTRILKDYDLALVRLPPDSKVKITEFGASAQLEQAEMVNDVHTLQCRVVNSGASLVYLAFRRFDMPEPGDSGSPILQGGKVIGLISSVTLNNCMGTAISSNILLSLEKLLK